MSRRRDVGAYTPAMIPHAFGRSAPLTIGVEEEVWVLDPGTLLPTPVPATLLDGERRKAELHREVIELTTGVCSDAVDVEAQLRAGRAEAHRLAAEEGVVLAASGTWPLGDVDAYSVTPEPGYLEFVEYAGSAALRQTCAGLHVHVGVESPEACMAALEWSLPWLPALLAVSASSPYLAAEETGLASTRAELLALLPRGGTPPAFASYEDFDGFAERLVSLGLADSWRRVWWDARPHPEFGTLEVRVPDQPTRVVASVAFAALVQAMVATAEPGPQADRAVYVQNRFAALRFGARAELVHPDGDRLVPAPVLLRELVALVTPAAERLGSVALLAPLDGLAQADEQLELGRRSGVRAVCDHLIAGS